MRIEFDLGDEHHTLTRLFGRIHTAVTASSLERNCPPRFAPPGVSNVEVYDDMDERVEGWREEAAAYEALLSERREGKGTGVGGRTNAGVSDSFPVL